jgi:CelD/BcsL family acetyltransferase involved in cellulose biosynthesis
MDIRRTKFEQLTGDEIAAWRSIQRTERTLDSPYFRPEFTEAVSAVRRDVEVAVLTQAGHAVGFFPYQRTRRNSARPVGDALSDFHGLIAPASVSCDPLDLLRACRLSAWHFSHVASEQSAFKPYAWREVASPYIDLSQRFDGYLAGKENACRLMSEFRKKMKKLSRDVGPTRFVPQMELRSLFSTLLEWKSEQYRRTRLPNIFDHAWVRQVLDRIGQYEGTDFSPWLSVLYAGKTVAALNFGMRCRDILHSWFPAYNVDLAVYSPGFLHWIELMQAAESLGIRRIDLGYGPETYKQRLLNGASNVAEGVVDLRRANLLVRRMYWSSRQRLGQYRIAGPARAPLRLIRRVRHWLDLRSHA